MAAYCNSASWLGFGAVEWIQQFEVLEVDDRKELFFTLLKVH